MADLEDLERGFRRLIAQWENDARGCRRLETQCGRSKEWSEAVTFKHCAETMERVTQEANALLRALSDTQGER